MADKTPYLVTQDDVEDTADEVQVQAPMGKAPETAAALLDAADALDLDPSVVKTADGHFLVPQEVADKAKLPEGAEQHDTHPNDGGAPGGTGDPEPGVAPEFRTKADAQAFAKEHDLDVADTTSDEYKAAVAKAYADKHAATN